MKMTHAALGAVLCAAPAAHAQQEGWLSVSVQPAFQWMTEAEAFGSFKVENPGSRPVEILVQADYGVIAASADGATTDIIKGEAGEIGDLSEHLTVFPPRLILDPGDSQIVRFGITDAPLLQTGGYVALLSFAMHERTPADEVPEEAAAVVIDYALVTPLVLFRGEAAPALTAEILDHSERQLSLLLHAENGLPWAGGISVVGANSTRSYGRAPVYLFTRQRVDIPLDAPLPARIQLVFDKEYPGISDAVKARLALPAALEVTLRDE